MRTVLTALLLATVAFAGCTSDPSEADPGPTGSTTTSTTSTSTSATTTTTTTSTTDPEPENRAPTSTFGAASLTGAAPLRVNFSMDAEDADGDALRWSLDVDGDGVAEASGSDLPATYEHEYAMEGVYVAWYNVTDGQLGVSKNATITVAAPAPVGPYARLETEWQVGATEIPGLIDYLECAAGPSNGITHSLVALPAASGGRAFTATLSSPDGLENIPEWGFYAFPAAACDGSDEVFFGEAASPVGNGVDGVIVGTLPASADTIFAYSTGGQGLLLEIVID